MRYFNIENNKLTYNALAEDYSRIYMRELAPKVFIDNFLKALPGKEVLDVGCGTGQIAKYMASAGFKIFGIDNSEKMIKIAARTAKACKFKVQNALEFVQKERFDGVLAHDCLFHFTPVQARSLFENMHQSLKPKGKALITFSEGVGEGFERLTPDIPLRMFIRKYTLQELNNILSDLFQITAMWVVNEVEDGKQVGRKIYLLLDKVCYKEEE